MLSNDINIAPTECSIILHGETKNGKLKQS